MCSKVRVKREDERVEIRWKLWLREKAILVHETDGGDADGWWARHVVRLGGNSVELCFDLGFRT